MPAGKKGKKWLFEKLALDTHTLYKIIPFVSSTCMVSAASLYLKYFVVDSSTLTYPVIPV